MDPWTFATLKHRVGDEDAVPRKPVPLPAKTMTPAAVRRRAQRDKQKRERESRRETAIRSFGREPTRLPPSDVLQELRRNPPESVSELLDRYWKPEHYLASQRRKRA